jgi:Fe-S-cluster-containing dehydrogenase component
MKSKYWQNLGDLKESALPQEPSQGLIFSQIDNPLTRRRFLTLMGASMALAGYTACRRPVEHIVPYVKSPEEIIPGVANYYATTMPFGNNAFGLIVESHEGRPTKIEGNPDHPATLGKSNPFIQASILDLYDPDRLRNVMHNGQDSTWDDFVAFWREQTESFQENGGAGLAILSEPFSSPTLWRLKNEFLARYPNAKWVNYEPASDENIYEGLRLATGKAYQSIYHFDKARVILSFDSDFIFLESDAIRNAADFADGRRVKSEKDDMNRLYVVESGYSLTGAMADHRLAIPSSMIGSFVREIAGELKRQGLAIPSSIAGYPRSGNFDPNWIRIVSSDLLSSKGKSIVIAGRSQSPEVHALVFAINSALGNIGNTTSYREISDTALSSRADLKSLASDMQDGQVSTLVIMGGNPVYDAPADLDFSEAMRKVEHAVHLSPHMDETSKQAEWVLPEAHYLESWGDARSIDGTISVVQPLIEPLFGGRSSIEIISLLTKEMESSGYDIVRETWESILTGPNYEFDWRQVLNDGLFKGKTPPTVIPSLANRTISLPAYSTLRQLPGPENLELVFCLSPAIYDGRYANNGWLQELPDPQTKICWDNPALISPKTARELNLANGDLVRIEYRGRTLEAPIWIMPGQANYSLILYLGYGREGVGEIGNDVGFNTYLLRTSDSPYYGLGAKLVKTGGRYKLAQTQVQGTTADRPDYREATLEYYREHPDFAPEEVEKPVLQSLWDEHSYTEGYQWGMAIDLNVCIGCNTCTAACQSENNIPIVGKEQVYRNRWMHWIRVDRYFKGEPDNATIVHQPVPCMHCENAPCEQVCPVNAAVHDHEGLNLQVYNRCIGTRYCSNNCPYKVRRFNFFNYTGRTPEIEKMHNNPNVTVRGRGVMEKCTYCLQRIKKAEFEAREENRVVRDGEIVPACAQACPTNAIVFGNVNEQDSQVNRLKAQNRNYAILIEYNTRPRTTYQARLRNPHPELKSMADEGI